jgi:hypothetical protein
MERGSKTSMIESDCRNIRMKIVDVRSSLPAKEGAS